MGHRNIQSRSAVSARLEARISAVAMGADQRVADTAAMWDFWSRGGPIDYTVLGLAAYELMMGLMEDEVPMPSSAPERRK